MLSHATNLQNWLCGAPHGVHQASHMGGCKKNCVTTIGIEELRTDGNRQDHHGQLLANCKKAEDMIGKNGLPKELQKWCWSERLQAELTDHLEYGNMIPARA